MTDKRRLGSIINTATFGDKAATTHDCNKSLLLKAGGYGLMRNCFVDSLIEDAAKRTLVGTVFYYQKSFCIRRAN
jgi:hypothetical protein